MVEKSLPFHGLINNCPGKSEKLKPQESLCVLLLLFSFQKQTYPLLQKKILEILKISKIPWETPTVHFCFSWRA